MFAQAYEAHDDDGNDITAYVSYPDEDETTSNVHIITNVDGCYLTWPEARNLAGWILRHAPEGDNE